MAIGLALVHLFVSLAAGPDAANIALGAAVCTSFADHPLPARRTAHRVATAAILSIVASGVILASRGSPVWLGLVIAGVGFVATLLLAWGPRAALVAFAPILAVVFELATAETAQLADDSHFKILLTTLPWHVTGALAYTLWAILCALALKRCYRQAALRDLLSAMALRLEARAKLVERPENDPARPDAWRSWLYGEADFADRLQHARDFMFEGNANLRERTILTRTVELRDSLVVSRFDRSLPGDPAHRRWLTKCSSKALRRIACDLEAAVSAFDSRSRGSLTGEYNAEALYDGSPTGADAAYDSYVQALRLRVRAMRRDAFHIAELARGNVQPRLSNRADVKRFISAERWQWRALATSLRSHSPVARHATRMAIAMGAAYTVAPFLPWTPHPQWVVLSVAVVLRGSLEQTLVRRNARVLGTFAGCFVVLALSTISSPITLSLLFLSAVAVAHAALTRRYWLAAAASTVMALLHSHAMDPAVGFAIGERAGDTVVGALFAWGFSYLLPSWERKKLPAAVQATVEALDSYTASAVRPPGKRNVTEQALARDRAHAALTSLASMMQRTAAEPKRVRLSEDALTALLDHGRRLMADVSAIRILRAELGGGAGAEARVGVGVGNEDGQTSMQAADARLAERLQSLDDDKVQVHAAAAEVLEGVAA